MKKTTIDFCDALESFFCDYLIKERRLSYNTLRSYKNMVAKLLEYFKVVKKISADKLIIEHLSRETIIDFLNWIEKDNAISTSNQRLAVLKSFAKYMMYYDPQHIALWKGIATIKPKRGDKGILSYLTVEAMAFLLDKIDSSTKSGLRDLTILTLMYHSGARVQEVADLTVDSIRWNKPYIIEIVGKGSKKRIVPIADDVIELVKQYLELYLPLYKDKHNHPLFFNVWEEKLTTSGIAYILKKHVDVARKLRPDLYPKRVSPHVLRHTKAMHMLQSGINIFYIRDILGHVSVETTDIYARADTKMKREALESAYEVVGVKEPEIKSWKKNKKIMEFLNNLLK